MDSASANRGYSNTVLCYRTHKVLCTSTVARREKSASQCYELEGTKRIYQLFKEKGTVCKPTSFSLNFDCFYIGVKVAVHCHDKNLSVAKFIRKKCLGVSETRDTWHGRYVVLVVYLTM